MGEITKVGVNFNRGPEVDIIKVGMYVHESLFRGFPINIHSPIMMATILILGRGLNNEPGKVDPGFIDPSYEQGFAPTK